MKIGMLWLDDNRRLTLEEKLLRAASYYQNKYGQWPEICLVNRKMLDEEMQVENIQVRPVRHVLPNHFLIGTKQV